MRAKLEQAFEEVQKARKTLKEVAKDVMVHRELEMMGEVEDALEGAIKFLEKRDG